MPISNPYTHPVTSVFDYSNDNLKAKKPDSWYLNDDVTMALNGLTATKVGADGGIAPGDASGDCYKVAPGRSLAELRAFFAYVGPRVCNPELSPGPSQYLSYENHPGYDYSASCGEEVRAPVGGVVSYVHSTEGDPRLEPKGKVSLTGKRDATGAHALAIEIKSGPAAGWVVRLLHLSSYPVDAKAARSPMLRRESKADATGHCKLTTASIPCDQCAKPGAVVSAGTLIGYTGDFYQSADFPEGWGGVGAHFHLEVIDKDGYPRDPYGWQGPASLPVPARANSRLWLTAPLGAPAAPSGLIASPVSVSSSSLVLTWSDNGTDEDGFQIERAPGATTSFVQIALVAANAVAFQDNGLAANTQYSYRVRSYRGAASSAYSNTASATTYPAVGGSALAIQPDRSRQVSVNSIWTSHNFTVVQDLPTGTAGTAKTVEIDYQHIDDRPLACPCTVYLAEYDDQARTLPSGRAVGDFTFAGPARQGLRILAAFTNPAGYDLNPAKYYRIDLVWGGLFFIDNFGVSATGDVYYAVRPSVTASFPAPENLAGSPQSSAQIGLTWTDNSSDEDGFQIDRAPAGTGVFTIAGTTASNVTTFTDNVPKRGELYDYRVSGIRGGVLSPPSNIASVASVAWSSIASLNTARSGVGVGLLGSTLYAVGGYTGQFTGFVEGLNPSSGLWEFRHCIPRCGVDYGVGLPNGAQAIGGKLYVSGGISPYGALSTLYAYDPTIDDWAVKQDMPSVGFGGASGAIGGLLYVVTFDGTSNRFFSYNPNTDAWDTTLVQPSHLLIQGGGGVIGGLLYIVGGRDAAGEYRSLDSYDPVTGQWTSLAPMPTPRTELGAVVANGKLIVAGGYRNGVGVQDVVEAYDPVTNKWSRLAPLEAPRRSTSLGAIGNVVYLIGGGWGASSAVVQTLQIY